MLVVLRAIFREFSSLRFGNQYHCFHMDLVIKHEFVKYGIAEEAE